MPLAKDMLFNHLKKPETTQDFHVLNVYKDPEFKKDVIAQFPMLEKMIDLENPYRNPNGTIDVRTKQKTYYGIEKMDDKQFYEIALKYAIHVNDIKIFLMGRHRTGNIYGPRRLYSLKPDISGDWVANIPTDISKEEYMKMWEEIIRNKGLQFQKKIPKRKKAKHDELLYAIFKARQRGMKFSEIHMAYQLDKLPYYTGPSNLFISQEKFEEYYRENRP